MTRTVEQIEHDLDTLAPYAAAPAPEAEASSAEHLAHYRSVLARAEREAELWRELYNTLSYSTSHSTPQWAVQAVLRAESGCIEHASEVRGWIREDERRLAVAR